MEGRETRKEGVGDDRAEPSIAGGFFAGADATTAIRGSLRVLRRFLWAYLGIGSLGVLLLGLGLWRFWALVDFVREFVQVYKLRGH